MTQNARHIGPSDEETQEMCKSLNVASLDSLIKEAIPENIVDPNALEGNVIGDPVQ